MPTRTATVDGLAVEITVPYTAGHVLTEIEANVLNQTFAENVRNGTAASVRKARETGQSEDAQRAIVQKYASEYAFSTRRPGRIADPIERECRRLAEAAVAASMKAKGKKPSDFTPEALERKIVEVSKFESIRKDAAKRVADLQKKAAEVDLSDIAA